MNAPETNSHKSSAAANRDQRNVAGMLKHTHPIDESDAASLREGYFKGLWPSGAPIEAWSEKCLDPAVRLLSQYVLDLEARLDRADRDANDLMAVAYQQGKAEAVEITSDEARARLLGWGEDVA